MDVVPSTLFNFPSPFQDEIHQLPDVILTQIVKAN